MNAKTREIKKAISRILTFNKAPNIGKELKQK